MNRLVFITWEKSVYSAVRTESFKISSLNFGFKELNEGKCEQDKQCTYNVTFSSIRAATVAMKMQ